MNLQERKGHEQSGQLQGSACGFPRRFKHFFFASRDWVPVSQVHALGWVPLSDTVPTPSNHDNCGDGIPGGIPGQAAGGTERRAEAEERKGPSPVMRQPYNSSLRAMPLCQLWGRMRTKRVSTGLWILLRTTSVASSLA